MSYFDHAAEARELLQSNAVALAADGAWGTAIAAEAQVHATLALVEQQRIANIIALASLRIAPDGAPPLRHLVIEPKDEYSVQPVAEIREALGL